MKTPPGVLRWLVVGSPGAGKSLLAREMGRRLGLPVIHLDSHYWRAGWVPTARDEWERRVGELLAPEEWIVDGNYSGTLALRLARAEAVVLVDLPAWLCLARVLRRIVQWPSQPRPDLPEGCPERLDFTFLWWVVSYPWRSRPKVLRRIAAHPHVRLHRLRSRGAVRRFLEGLAAT